MIDVELTMSVPFVLLSAYNSLRKRLLDAVVDSVLVAVQTREVVLRTLDSQYGPIFVRLRAQAEALHVDICEKRNVLLIEQDISDLNEAFVTATHTLTAYGVPVQHLNQLVSALKSNNPALRVSGKCAVILLLSFIELDSDG